MTGSLVELSQTGTQICRITFFTRHFLQTSRHLSKSLCPTGSGVCHQRYGISHITEIFCNGNTGINRCLTGRNRHIGSIGNKHSSLHQRLACFRVFQFRKLVQYVCHLVSAFSAADIYNDVRFRPFCQLVLNNGFSASEWSRNGCHTTFGNREESINNTLSRYQRHFRRKFFQIGTAFTNRPFLRHGKFSVTIFSCNHSHHFVYGKFSCFNLFDSTFDAIRNHDFMIDYDSLLYRTDNVAGFHRITWFYRRNKVPFQISFQRRNFHTSL